MIFDVVCLWYLIEMSSVCDSYWSRDYHDDIGIRVVRPETRVVSLAEDVKGNAVESLDREESPEPEACTSCPKKLSTTVRKRRVSSDAS